MKLEEIEKIRKKLFNGKECNEPYWKQAIAMGDFNNMKALKNSTHNYPEEEIENENKRYD